MDISDSSAAERKLRLEINYRIDQARRRLRINQYLNVGLSLATVLAGAGVTFMMSYGEIINPIQRVTVAGLALMPTLFQAINHAMSLESRAQWEWKRKRSYEGVLRGLNYEGLDVPTASKQVTKIESDLARHWARSCEKGRSFNRPQSQ